MKHIVFILFFFVGSCKNEDSKYELIESRSLKKNGPILNSTIAFETSVYSANFNLNGNDEFRSVKLIDVNVDFLFNEVIPKADSIEYELYYEEKQFNTKFIPTHRGTIRIIPGTTSKDLSNNKFSLDSISLEAITILNDKLNEEFLKGRDFKFILVARVMPPNNPVTGSADITFEFEQVVWGCRDPEIYFLNNSPPKYIGPCN